MQVEREIREFLRRDLDRNVEHVGSGQSLLEAGILDSLGVLALVSFIEERYRIGISDDELLPEHFDSIGAIAAFIARRQGAQGA